jgi:hypothetical protein
MKEIVGYNAPLCLLFGTKNKSIEMTQKQGIKPLQVAAFFACVSASEWPQLIRQCLLRSSKPSASQKNQLLARESSPLKVCSRDPRSFQCEEKPHMTEFGRETCSTCQLCALQTRLIVCPHQSEWNEFVLA